MKAVRLVIVALLVCWAGIVRAEVPIPQLTGRVVDQTATLSGDDIAALNETLRNLQARKGSQVAVLIVPTTQPETIEQFSIKVAEAWQIGRRKIDDGALLVIAKNDRHLRIEVGYGLEGALTDVTARRIIDEDITPKFRNGDFAGGVKAGVGRIVSVIDGEPLPAPAPEASHGLDFDFDWNTLWTFGLFFVVGAMFAGSFLRQMFGSLIGSAVVGWVAGVIAWVVVGSLIAGLVIGPVAFLIALILGNGTVSIEPSRRRGYSGTSSSSWSGGSSSSDWSSGSSSSDSGSFSGGGGSFGGGGASGSW
jgi:uncharacterized protein